MVVELRTSRGKTSSSLLVLCLTLLFAWLIVSPWIAASAIPDIQSDPELLRSWRAHPLNPAYGHRLRGGIRQFSITLQDYQEALREYQLALLHHPLSSRTWFDLARAHSWIGNTEEAQRDLNLALRFNPTDARLRWEAALLQIQLDHYDDAVEHLRYLVRIDRSRRGDYFALIRTLTAPSDLLETIIPPERELLSDYLDYLISYEEATNDAKAVWKRLARIPGEDLPLKLMLSYVDLMISHKEISEAHTAWAVAVATRKLADPEASDNLIWNSGFERAETLGKGFDWGLESVAGAEAGIDHDTSREGNRSLRISFDGTQNVDFSGVSQVVRVKPGTRYVLGGYIRTRGVTTASGVRIEAVDLLDGKVYGATETLVSDNEWSKVQTSFLTSSQSQAMVVRIRREASQRLDSLVRGTAWIDQVYLKHIS